ncbi:hypothetical protein M0R45_015576 [Rubus argutus]|uniref:Uncharacterized protein n=1 Tax=Rubus argutus TaxID=59490 RepID=A0AAW1XS19_RUBAR
MITLRRFQRTCRFLFSTSMSALSVLHLYVLFILEHGVEDLESFVLLNFDEGRSLLVQVTAALAVVEAAYEFEHLDVLQDSIFGICIPQSIGAIWNSCNVAGSKSKARKLPKSSDSGFNFRRRLAMKGYDNCTTKGEAAFVSTYAIHQLHIFTVVLQVFHVLYCIATLALGRYKVSLGSATRVIAAVLLSLVTAAGDEDYGGSSQFDGASDWSTVMRWLYGRDQILSGWVVEIDPSTA